MIQPGEVYMADFGPAGPHPARFAIRSKLSDCVPFQAGDFGFTVDCVAQCENTFP